jgi:hypothetical protein
MVTLTLTELQQAILCGLLPWGAWRQSSWWSNTAVRSRPQNRAWLDAGWRVASFARDLETVTFERFDQGTP